MFSLQLSVKDRRRYRCIYHSRITFSTNIRNQLYLISFKKKSIINSNIFIKKTLLSTQLTAICFFLHRGPNNIYLVCFILWGKLTLSDNQLESTADWVSTHIRFWITIVYTTSPFTPCSCFSCTACDWPWSWGSLNEKTSTYLSQYLVLLYQWWVLKDQHGHCSTREIRHPSPRSSLSLELVHREENQYSVNQVSQQADIWFCAMWTCSPEQMSISDWTRSVYFSDVLIVCFSQMFY